MSFEGCFLEHLGKDMFLSFLCVKGVYSIMTESMMKNVKNEIRFILLSIFCFSMLESVQAQIYINEISVCNVSKQLDPNYDYRGWIELYNASDNEYEMREFYFSDEPGNPKKYRLQTKRILPAHGYAVIWLNDEVNDQNGGFLDTDEEGGFLSVSDKQGNLLDAFQYPEQYTDISYGRTVDGDTQAPFAYFLQATMSESNNGTPVSNERVATPVLSVKSGFYQSPFSVSIQCATPGAKIYYTLDGTNPTPDKKLYTAPILITSTTSLRAKAYAEGKLEGIAVTATYMLNERKPDLPVVFMTLDTVYLYNDSIGIYCVGTNGVSGGGGFGNYNRDWTRYGHFELLDEQGNNCLNQDVGYAINGNGTRLYDQKSLKVKAGGKYGEKRLNYELFSSKSGRRYKSILLRNGGQYYVGLSLVRDAILQELADVTPLTYQAYRPCVAYLNGEYWGLYNMRERNNKDNLYSNYGYKSDEFDLIDNAWSPKVSNGNMLEYNKMKDYFENNDLTTDQSYEQISRMIDIDNYLYYMAIEILLRNDDWPANNQKLFRPKKEDGKWRWILQDLDNTLKTGTGDKLGELFDDPSNKFSIKMISYLLKNERVKNQYIDIQCLVAGSIYNPKRVSDRMTNAWSRIKEEYPYHFAKWPYMKEKPEKELASMLEKQAASNVFAYTNLKSHFELGTPHDLSISSNHADVSLSFNALQIPVLPYEGKYFEGRDLCLKAPLYDRGEKFAYWEVTKADGISEKVENQECTLHLSAATQVRAVYVPVQESRRNGLYINEISASNAIFVDNADKYEDWIEIYNSCAWPVDLAGYYLSDDSGNYTLSKVPDGDESTVVPARGHVIVWCSKKPERGALHTKFKLAKEGGVVCLSKEYGAGNVLLVDSVHYAPHTDYTSFGRYPDGGETLVSFDIPTFKKANQYSTYNVTSYVEDYRLVSGIETPKQDIEVEVYTDESNSWIYIEGSEALNFRLSDVNGTIFRTGEKTADTPASVDISALQKGIYLLSVDNEKGSRTLKIMK